MVYVLKVLGRILIFVRRSKKMALYRGGVRGNTKQRKSAVILIQYPKRYQVAVQGGDRPKNQ